MKTIETSIPSFNTSILCIGYLTRKFPEVNMEKLKAGIVDGPQIRQLIKDLQFTASMNEIESNFWCSFVKVVKQFRGNYNTLN